MVVYSSTESRPTPFLQRFSFNWLYGAAMQIAMNGSQPKWTKDEWSFVPLDLHKLISLSGRSNLAATEMSSNAAYNVTASIPAVRVRVGCDTIPAIRNMSSWLGVGDVENVEDIGNETAQSSSAYRVNTQSSRSCGCADTHY